MITRYRYDVSTASGAFVAAGVILGTLEDAKTAACKAAFADGQKPTSKAEREYKFNYRLIETPHGRNKINGRA